MGTPGLDQPTGLLATAQTSPEVDAISQQLVAVRAALATAAPTHLHEAANPGAIAAWQQQQAALTARHRALQLAYGNALVNQQLYFGRPG